MVNAYILYHRIQAGRPKIELPIFRTQVAEALSLCGIVPQKRPVGRPSSTSKNERPKAAKRAYHPTDDVRYDQVGHWCVFRDRTGKKQCKFPKYYYSSYNMEYIKMNYGCGSDDEDDDYSISDGEGYIACPPPPPRSSNVYDDPQPSTSRAGRFVEDEDRQQRLPTQDADDDDHDETTTMTIIRDHHHH
ncbi:hypothetical protein QE152_g33460 [Popillia japonica]|uniref:Uncharacterized protein n=1 Tax=Popillia japonica TaxID=7064 RepID=A0AAW1IWB3_POPJA